MSSERFPLALAQINPTVGAIRENGEMIAAWMSRAREAGAALVVFPELAISGYPPEDLLLKAHFLDAVGAELETLAALADGIVAVVGFPERGDAVYNSAAVLAGGRVAAVYRKMLLPNYGVFDERRYFEPGEKPALIEVNGVAVGLTICEDIWYPGAPASLEAETGAQLVVNPSASPYHRRKGIGRERMVSQRARETGCAFALCNLVGGQDELVFDGHSVVVAAGGQTLARAAQFSEELLVCDLELAAGTAATDGPAGVLGAFPVPVGPDAPRAGGLAEPLDPLAEIYGALTLGLRDYVEKNGFAQVLVAVSGGIDSALVALLAADALGADRLVCVVMPSPHSSESTQADARAIAENLGAELVEMPIADAMDTYDDLLDGSGDGSSFSEGLMRENLQARIRGNLMMALSNRSGALVLTTGNKSEMSVGYATLYGDMAGGLAVIKDVPKTLVYDLVRHRNEREGRELIPASVLERPPSAELRADQLDEDSLPPYAVLDRILELYVEGDADRDAMIAEGLDAGVVDEVVKLVDLAEYKRRQAPPGIKITPKSFGRDRRLPITNRFAG